MRAFLPRQTAFALVNRRKSLHESKEVLRLAGAEIRISCFERIRPENVQMRKDLLCPRQGSRAACRDQVSVGNRGHINIKACPFVIGTEHFEEPGAVARMRTPVQQTGAGERRRRSANGAYRTSGGKQLRRFFLPQHRASDRPMCSLPVAAERAAGNLSSPRL